jgi:hypothetical protein
MKPLKFLIAAVALFAATLQAHAQSTPLQFVGRYNLGVGIQYNNLYYGDVLLPYSPGGGMGLEAGLRFMPSSHFEPYATVGYQQNLAIKVSDADYVNNDSYFTFSRVTFNAGVNYKFPVIPNTNKLLRIGGGLNFSIPGWAGFKENNEKYPSIKYQMARGFNIETSFVVYEDRKVTVEPGLRYRHIEFKPAGNRVVPANMNPAQASGFDLSVIVGLNL